MIKFGKISSGKAWAFRATVWVTAMRAISINNRNKNVFHQIDKISSNLFYIYFKYKIEYNA